MAKFSYIHHLFEVAAVAVETPCDFGEAWDRFRADVESGAGHDYNTGKACEYFDFALAGKIWNSMSEAEQQAARDEWYAYTQEGGVYKTDLVRALCNGYRAWRDMAWTH